MRCKRCLAFVLALFLLLSDSSRAFAYDDVSGNETVPFIASEYETQYETEIISYFSKEDYKALYCDIGKKDDILIGKTAYIETDSGNDAWFTFETEGINVSHIGDRDYLHFTIDSLFEKSEEQYNEVIIDDDSKYAPGQYYYYISELKTGDGIVISGYIPIWIINKDEIEELSTESMDTLYSGTFEDKIYRITVDSDSSYELSVHDENCEYAFTLFDDQLNTVYDGAFIAYNFEYIDAEYYVYIGKPTNSEGVHSSLSIIRWGADVTANIIGGYQKEYYYPLSSNLDSSIQSLNHYMEIEFSNGSKIASTEGQLMDSEIDYVWYIDPYTGEKKPAPKDDEDFVLPGVYYISKLFDFYPLMEPVEANARIVVLNPTEMRELNSESEITFANNGELNYWCKCKVKAGHRYHFYTSMGEEDTDIYLVNSNNEGIDDYAGEYAAEKDDEIYIMINAPEDASDISVGVKELPMTFSVIDNRYEKIFYYGIQDINRSCFEGLKIESYNADHQLLGEYWVADEDSGVNYELVKEGDNRTAELDEQGFYPIGIYDVKLSVDGINTSVSLEIVSLDSIPEIIMGEGTNVSASELITLHDGERTLSKQWVRFLAKPGKTIRINSTENFNFFDAIIFGKEMSIWSGRVRNDGNEEAYVYVCFTIAKDSALDIEYMPTITDITVLDGEYPRKTYYNKIDFWGNVSTLATITICFEDGETEIQQVPGQFREWDNYGIGVKLCKANEEEDYSDSENDIYSLDDLEAGDYRMVFYYIDNCSIYDYYEVEVKDLEDCETLQINGPAVTAYKSLYEGLDDNRQVVRYTGHSPAPSIYQMNLDAGDYAFFSDGKIWAEIYDETYNQIYFNSKASDGVYFSVSDSGIYYVKLMANSSTENFMVSLVESKVPAEVELVKKPLKSEFTYGFDDISFWGLSVKIRFSDGSYSDELSYGSTEFNNYFVTKCERTDGKPTILDIYDKLPAGKYDYIFYVTGMDNVAVSVPFSILPFKKTGDLLVGESLPLKCNLEKKNGEYISSYSMPAHYVAVDLVEGQTYHIVRDEVYTSMHDLYAGEVSVYSPSFDKLTNLYNGAEFNFTAQETGTHYLRIYSKGGKISINKILPITEVEVLSPQYSQYIVSGFDNIPSSGNMRGLQLRMKLANGEEIIIDYLDSTWNYYGISYEYLFDSEGNNVLQKDNKGIYGYLREPSEDYYYKLVVPGYYGEIQGEEKLKVTCVDKYNGCLTVTQGNEKEIETKDDQVVDSVYYFCAEIGKTYKLVSSETVGVALLSSSGRLSSKYIKQGDNNIFVADRTDYYFVISARNINQDEKCFLKVTEVNAPISMSISGNLIENSFEYGVESPAPNGISISLLEKCYKGKDVTGNDIFESETREVLFSEFEKEGIIYKVYTKDKKTAKYDSQGFLPKGTYIFGYIVPGYDGVQYDTVHPFEVVDCAKNYKVIFKANYPNGTEEKKPKEQTIATNKSVALLVNKYKFAGYEFLGWKDSDGYLYADKEVVYNLVSDGSTVELYAQWELAAYNVNWHMAGGRFVEGYTPIESYNIMSDEIELPDKEKIEPITGFEFDGWYQTADYKKKAANIVTGSIGTKDIYAKWVPTAYSVKFNGNGNNKGGSMKDQTVYYGVDVNLSSNAYKDTRAFMYWSYDVSGMEKAFDNKAQIDISKVSTDRIDNKLLTLYAQWKETFDISVVDLGGGEYKEGTLMPTEYQYGKTVTLPTPIKEGYTFAGWYMDSEYTTKISKITSKMAEDVCLYANWKPITYTVKLSANGGSGKVASLNMVYDEAKKLNKNVYTKKGCRFGGWTDNAYAKKANMLSPEEYETFKGTYKVYEDEEIISNLSTKKKTITLAAVWVETSYTVEFNPVGGTDVSENNGTYKYNAKAEAFALPGKDVMTKENYNFAGWYKDPQYKTQVKTSKGLAEDLVLYAKWTANYVVVFNANSPDNKKTMRDETMVYGNAKALTANAFTKAGYVFMGWATSLEDANDGIITYYDKEKITGIEDVFSIDLYAVWRNTFCISYNVETASGTVAYMPSTYIDEYTYGNEIELPKPIREGYTFAGWYTNETLKSKLAKITKKTSGDLELYAKWTGRKYTINFDANAPSCTKVSGKTGKASMVYGTAKALPKNCYKISGYTFKGWAIKPLGEVVYTNAEKVSDHNNAESTICTVGDYCSSVTLYAVWEKESYDIKYVMNGVVEDVILESAYTVDTAYTLIEEPKRLGYTFLGFYTDKSCKKKAKDLTVGTTGDKIFYAKWKANQ